MPLGPDGLHDPKAGIEQEGHNDQLTQKFRDTHGHKVRLLRGNVGTEMLKEDEHDKNALQGCGLFHRTVIPVKRTFPGDFHAADKHQTGQDHNNRHGATSSVSICMQKQV